VAPDTSTAHAAPISPPRRCRRRISILPAAPALPALTSPTPAAARLALLPSAGAGHASGSGRSSSQSLSGKYESVTCVKVKQLATGRTRPNRSTREEAPGLHAR